MNSETNLQQEQIQLTRNGLFLNAAAKYHELITHLKKLPIPQETAEMTHAYLEMAGAMLWIKEVIMAAPLTFAQPEVAPLQPASPPETKEEEQGQC